MIRAVVDTNVLVRAVIKPNGTVGPILSRLAAGDYLLVFSGPILDEFFATMALPRIRIKYGIDDETMETVMSLFALRGVMVTPKTRIDLCRDPKDDMFIEAADAGQASWIVTGDEDLLVLRRHGGTRIEHPSTFLRHLDDPAQK